MNYDAYHSPRTTAMVLSTDFSAVQPVEVQGYFKQIHDVLRLVPNNHAETALRLLTEAAEAYVLSTRNSHGW